MMDWLMVGYLAQKLVQLQRVMKRLRVIRRVEMMAQRLGYHLVTLMEK